MNPAGCRFGPSYMRTRECHLSSAPQNTYGPDPSIPAPAIVERWLSSLRPVESEGVEAWVNDSWNVLATRSAALWSAEDVELAVALIRPARIELAEFFEEEGIDRSAEPWKAFADGIRPILGEGLTLPEAWFSIGMAMDVDDASTHWSWTAIALSPDRALFCERSDRYGSPAFPHPFGVITGDNMFRSAALLMTHCASASRNYFVAPRFLDEIHSTEIPDAELYRILLAACGHGGREILHLERTALPHVQARNMRYGFADVLERLDAHL